MTVRSPLKWVGGKAESARRIIQAFPQQRLYTTYCEPCCGAAHVLAAKPRYGYEVLNDLNDDLINFLLHCQNHREALIECLASWPWSRSLYYQFYDQLFRTPEHIGSLERAAMWFYVLRASGTAWLRETPTGWNYTRDSVNAYYVLLEEGFTRISQRLARVVIDNRDVLETIRRYESPTTLFYVDPPYVGAEHYYQLGLRKYQKTTFDHAGLAEVLNDTSALVALSYYPHPQLESWYPSEKWRRLTWTQRKHSDLGEGEEATEMLLLNYPAPQGLWDSTA